MRAPLGCVLLALAIASCSGANSAIPQTPPGGGSHAEVTVKFRVLVPTARRRGPHARRISAKLRHIWSVAENTMGIQIISYAHGDRTTPLGTVVANIAQGSAKCSAASSFYGRTCNIDLQATPGNDDFVATTYDKVPVGGAIPAGANQLGYGIATQTVTAGTALNNINLSIEGVLAKLQLSVTPDTVHTLVPTTVTLNAYALDADGDVIVSNGYIDSTGKAVTVGLSVSNPLPLGSPSPSPSPGLTLAQATLTAPQPAGVAVNYAPAGSGFAPAAATVTISASPSASSVTTTSATLKAIAPSASQIVITNLNQNNPYHGGMAFDNSGNSSSSANNVYFTGAGGFGTWNECANCGYAGQTTPAQLGTATAPLRGGIAGTGTPAAGGLPIYTVTGTTAVDITTSGGTLTAIGVSAQSAPIPNGSQMIYDGSRGDLWYASGTNIIAYPTTGLGTIGTNGIGAATIGGLALDSGNNVWIVDTVHNRIRECTSTTLCNAAIALNGTVFDVVDETNLASAERLIVTDHGNNTLIVLNTSGAVVATLTLPAGASPYYITPDNLHAGVVWFDYLYNGAIGIGRLDMNQSTPQFLMANGPLGVASSSSTPTPGAIGVSPSSPIYTAFDGAATLVQWIP